MSGRVLRARVKLDPTSPAGHVEAFGQSDGWTWATGTAVSDLGAFTDVTLALDSPAALDSTAMLRIGLQYYAYAPGTVQLLVDDFRLEPAN